VSGFNWGKGMCLWRPKGTEVPPEGVREIVRVGVKP